TNEAKHAKDHQRFSQSNPVNDETANEHRKNVGKAINGLQESDVQIRKPKLLLEHIGERAKSVVHVIAAKHRQTDKDQDQPPVQAARFRSHSFRHPRSLSSSRLNSWIASRE